MSISEQRLLEIVDPLWDFLYEEEEKSNAFSEIVKDWQKFESIDESLKGPILHKYNDRDYAIIANNVFFQLCQLDEPDRKVNRDPQWHDIAPLADQVRAFDNKNDVAYIAEQVLLQLHFIDLDKRNNNVRLTKLGRENCSKGIDIPLSDIQELRMRFNL